MANLVNILKDVISLIDLEIKVLNLIGTRYYLCKTLHLTIGKIVKDNGGNDFKITAFKDNDWIELVPFGHSNAFIGSVVICPAITFLHGSPSSVDKEYAQVDQQTLNKTPFIWLLEPYDEDKGEADSVLDCSFSARLFFMDWAYNQGWQNDQHNTNVIVPMENLRDAFNDVIDASFSFRNTTVIRSKPRSRFGVVISNKGSNKTIINEDLSGLEVNADLDLFNTDICKC
jgi:hypothetical protein|tara:strand:- start:89 stop:775 length:687 start_codon:yes stop_codon:yes gene_type:complete